MSDELLGAALHRDLRRRRLGEQWPPHLCRHFGDVARGDLGSEQVVALVLLDGQVVGPGPRGDQPEAEGALRPIVEEPRTKSVRFANPAPSFQRSGPGD